MKLDISYVGTYNLIIGTSYYRYYECCVFTLREGVMNEVCTLYTEVPILGQVFCYH